MTYTRFSGPNQYRKHKIYKSNDSQIKGVLKRYLRSLNYKDMLVIQSDRDLWEQLLMDPDPLFRRQLCTQAYKITQEQISHNVSGSTKTGFALINETLKPDNFNTFVLAIMCNVPWQIITEKNPSSIRLNRIQNISSTGLQKDQH